MTLKSVKPTQFNVIYRNVGLKCFTKIYHNVCLFVIIVIRSYFSYILQGSVETHLQCGEIHNNHIIADCPQSVPMKKI